MIGELVGSRRIYDGKVLRLRVDEVQLPSGEVTRREIVEHPGAVAIVPFKDHENIIMIKQLRHAVDGWLLEIPAGTLDKDEAPRRCASRELIEETGFKASRMMRMFSCYVAPGYSNELIHEFVATDLKYVGQRTESDEFVKTVTMNIKEAANKIAKGSIRDAKTICGLLYVLRRFPEIERWLKAKGGVSKARATKRRHSESPIDSSDW
jgi:ADP-ribose pyrophosphatase